MSKSIRSVRTPHARPHPFKLLAVGLLLSWSLLLLSPFQNVLARQTVFLSTIVAGDGRRYTAPAAPVPFAPSARGKGIPVSESAPALPLPTGIQPALDYGPASVIGEDGRARVRNTQEYPFRAIAWLLMTFPGGIQYSCTGWFAGPRTVVTAGHCIYDQSAGWATFVSVYPGRNGNRAPFGSEAAAQSQLRSVAGWVDMADHRFDYGAIILQSNWRKRIGYFGFYPAGHSRLQDLNAALYGYPADKPTGTLWGMTGVIRSVNRRKLFYDADTYGGQSGSAVWHDYQARCKPCAVGVHGYGVGMSSYPDLNSGARINRQMFNNLYQWRLEK